MWISNTFGESGDVAAWKPHAVLAKSQGSEKGLPHSAPTPGSAGVEMGTDPASPGGLQWFTTSEKEKKY